MNIRWKKVITAGLRNTGKGVEEMGEVIKQVPQSGMSHEARSIFRQGGNNAR